MNKYLTYEEAKAFVKSLGLVSFSDWVKYTQHKEFDYPFINRAGISLPKRPPNIPYEPHKFYTKTNEWISWADFLNYSTTKTYWTYQQAKEYAQHHHIKSERQWYAHHKQHQLNSIPKKISSYFKRTGEWISWPDFLDHHTLHSTEKHNLYLTALQAKKYIHSLNLKNITQYRKWWSKHKPYFLPRCIDVIYRRTNDFTSFNDFLGQDSLSRIEVITQDISVLYVAKIPSAPDNVYEVAINKKGHIDVTTKAQIQKYQVIKIYQYDETNFFDFQQIMNRYCSPWWQGGNNQYAVHNINQLIYELNMLF